MDRHRGARVGTDSDEVISKVHTYCSLCGVGCPSVITVEGSRVVSLRADDDHPLGGLTCAKGKAAPEIHDHPHRVNHPLKRTNPKGASDPGWERCSWDEALDLVAERLTAVRADSGAEAVVFTKGTSGGTGMLPSAPWIERLARSFGTPNMMNNDHICNWARDGATYYTFGTYGLPAPDVERSNCILVWGANPSATVINLASAIATARARGARLVVVDPRRTGLANKADLLLQVRPGTDGALALAFIHVLISNGWFDDGFVRTWTNAPFLVRTDTGRLLRSDQLATQLDGFEVGNVALHRSSGRLVRYTPGGGYDDPPGDLALRGAVDVDLVDGSRVTCRPVFDMLADLAERCGPPIASEITGVPEPTIHEAVRLMVDNRPVSHHAWNGIVLHSNGTQTARAIEVFYALLGDWDRPGGNVERSGRLTRPIAEAVPIPEEIAAKRLGIDTRPLGPPSVPGDVASFDFYTAVLDGQPYQVRALVSFGSNTILNSGDPLRGRAVFEQLEFFVAVELFHTPTTRYADVVLPAASFLEKEDFAINRTGYAVRRRRAVAPLYERRSDIQIVFDLASRLGLEHDFADGDIEAAFDEVLGPTGVSWDGLLDHAAGVAVFPPPTYEKHASPSAGGGSTGFPTPSRKVELFVDRFAALGHAPLPEYEEPAQSPRRTPELAREYPLVLTDAKRPRWLHSQHRGLESLRRRNPDPGFEIHPETAARFGVANGDWMYVETPVARIRVRATVTPTIAEGVVCGTHGWWERCEPTGSDALDPFSERGANINLLVTNDLRDPIGGGVSHRSSLCRVRPAPDGGG
jgi:anaerobic selenocysteine-containing dehydrogenase